MTDQLDLSIGKYLRGFRQDDTAFVSGTRFVQLRGIMRNPRELQGTAKRNLFDQDIETEASIHELVQRALTGNKRSNVPVYAEYIKNVVMKHRTGVLPPLHLWCAERLEVIENGSDVYLLVPDGVRLIAIDGETQLTAHFDVFNNPATTPELRKIHGDFPLTAIVHHNLDVPSARQYFHDLNVLAVRPNTSLSLAMDTVDPLMRIVSDLEVEIPFLTGNVDKQNRQLNKNSLKVLTVQSLRQMTINVAKGIAGIQYGAKTVPLDEADLPQLAAVSKAWFTAVFNEFAHIMRNRETHLISSGPVLAAIAALGNTLLSASPEERPQLQEQLLASLRNVDWRKGAHWSGIAGRLTDKGAFSVSGTKEVGYNVFNVLADPDNSNYSKVRQVKA